ncbi:MAG TPA: hypothetical protein VJH03_13005 [Blastocatellia bacterium]|nr:hypothetical protein [Blastocatellia bacterium]
MKRLFGCLLLMAVLPFLAESALSRGAQPARPFASTALAGHSSMGGYCDCGSPGCVCDPGDVPPTGNAALPADNVPAGDSVDQSPAPGADPTPGMLLIALAFLLWFKMR